MDQGKSLSLSYIMLESQILRSYRIWYDWLFLIMFKFTCGIKTHSCLNLWFFMTFSNFNKS